MSYIHVFVRLFGYLKVVDEKMLQLLENGCQKLEKMLKYSPITVSTTENIYFQTLKNRILYESFFGFE